MWFWDGYAPERGWRKLGFLQALRVVDERLEVYVQRMKFQTWIQVPYFKLVVVRWEAVEHAQAAASPGEFSFSTFFA